MDYYEQIYFNECYFPAREERFQNWIGPNGAYQIHLPLAAALFGLGTRCRAIDVGANVGLISRIFSVLYEEVIAFEPSPQNRACLSRNLSPEFNNVVIYPYALGGDDKKSWIDETSSNCGGDLLVESDLTSSDRTNRPLAGRKPITVKTLDGILKEDCISVIKIDVQGGEADVLRGGEQLILKNTPIILVETGGEGYDNSSEIEKLLLDLGYRGRVAYGKLDCLYFHQSSSACNNDVLHEILESQWLLTKKFARFRYEVNEILSDVNRESERIKLMFGI